LLSQVDVDINTTKLLYMGTMSDWRQEVATRKYPHSLSSKY
jgi:hypothetical protein